MILIGPCMFVAPLLVVLLPIALVLWPPVLIIVGLAWLVTLPFRHGNPASGMARAHHKIGHWFWTVLRPWDYFDIPQPAGKKADATAKAAAGAGAGAAAKAAVPTADPMTTTASHPTPP